jgi:Raf kinase inhibitor-like YbhB/YbcL family protein
MRVARSSLQFMIVIMSVVHLGLNASPQNPPADAGRGAQRGAVPPDAPGGRGRGGRGRGGAQTMTLSTTAWSDGGQMPAKYTQAGAEVSPPLTWSNVPDSTASFVLIVHDPDAATGNGTDDVLHWLLWNVPSAATGVPEGVPQASQLPDGTRQISATGPYYRGPGAAAAGPAHHYTFELYALDRMLDVQPVGASPAQTRAAVLAAMAGHVRGKAALVALFKRPQ